MNRDEAKQIAATILHQLGGQKFVAMTGAHSFTSGEDGTLSFRFRMSKSWKALNVTLNSMDTYDMTFYKIGNAPTHKVTTKKINGIYFDQLQEIFTKETGLNTHL